MEPKHEVTDMQPRWVLYFAIATIVAAVFIHLLVWQMYRVFERQQAAQDRRPSLVKPDETIPPEPQLQVQPGVDFEAYLKQQTETLTTYEWVDRDTEIARIPIDRAMELLVERGRR